ncbi:MAG: aryl-sulfate sulfotransferase [Candidatus Omnitrophica bacterium]|nr:aryl-sulfate sulfotransferase [Candidatus Omnitrophota bacterium]
MSTAKKYLFVVMVIVSAAYAIAFTKNAAFLYFFLSISAYSVCLFLYSLLLKSIWKKFNPSIEKIYQTRKKIFWAATLTSFLLFIAGGILVNRYIQNNTARLISTLSLLCFSVFLAENSLNPKKKKIIKLTLFIILFSLFVFLLKLSGISFFSKIIVSPEEQLKSLPYLTWVPAKDNLQYAGVIKYDQNKAYKGINIYNSDNSKTIHLTDMQGNLLHSWTTEIGSGRIGFHHHEINKDGSVLVIINDRYLACLDWNSKTLWEKKERAHHDVRISDSSDIYLLSRKDEIVWRSGIPMPILNDYIVIYSKEGEKKTEISLYKVLGQDVAFKYFLKSYYNVLQPYIFLRTIKYKYINKLGCWFLETSPQDFFHTNSIQVIDKDIPGLCKKNDVLVSFRNLDLIAIIDMMNEKIIWKWGPGNLRRQHHPTLLKNNNILIFDNGDAKKRNYSRVIELNPFTKQIVWEYKAEPPEKFFSGSRGACQRLPNGNTLITNSDSGYVFEVTKNGEIVWEFYTPDVDTKNKKRAAFYRLMRIVNPEDYPILSTLK